MSVVSQPLVKHNVEVKRWRVDIHRDEAIVNRFDRPLAERLFGHQYAQEMRFPSGTRSVELVKSLPAVVAALNGKVIRLTGKKPSEAVKTKVTRKPSSVVPDHPLDILEQKLPSGVGVRYLYQHGELEVGGVVRLTLYGH